MLKYFSATCGDFSFVHGSITAITIGEYSRTFRKRQPKMAVWSLSRGGRLQELGPYWDKILPQ